MSNLCECQGLCVKVEEVTAAVLGTLGELSLVGGDTFVAHLHHLLPEVIGRLQASNSEQVRS